MSAQDLRRRRLRWLRFRRRKQRSTTMTVMEHLGELRTRLIVSAAAFAVAAVGVFVVYEPILDVLVSPLCAVDADLLGEDGCTLQTFKPTEGLLIRLKIASMGGMILASPIWLYQIWAFVTPGLTMKEKRYAVPFILASILLFLCGAAVALLTFKPALRFLVGVGGENLETFFTPTKYLGLITLMILAFGLAFEFPILLVFLQLAGVVPSSRLRKWRRPALVFVVAVAAVITPSGDPYSLFAMAGPMYLFYEGAILVGRLLKK